MHVYSLNVLCTFLKEALIPLGDAEYQKKVWLKQESDLVDSYDSTMTRFLDLSEEIFQKPDNFEGVSEEIEKILRQLYKEVVWFDENVAFDVPHENIEAILKNPKWNAIQAHALNAYQEIITHLRANNYECHI